MRPSRLAGLSREALREALTAARFRPDVIAARYGLTPRRVGVIARRRGFRMRNLLGTYPEEFVRGVLAQHGSLRKAAADLRVSPHRLREWMQDREIRVLPPEGVSALATVPGEVLHALYLREGTLAQTAKALGVGRNTLWKVFKRRGLACRQGRPCTFSPLQVEQIRRLHAEGFGPAAVARAVGRTETSVGAWMRRHGLRRARRDPQPTPRLPRVAVQESPPTDDGWETLPLDVAEEIVVHRKGTSRSRR